MRKGPEQVLKLACLLLAALLCLQIARLFARGTPLKSLTVPALPQLAASNDSTNSVSSQTSKGTNSAAGTNTTSGTSSTNGTNSSTATNVTAKVSATTNVPPVTNVASTSNTKSSGTNVVAGSSTNKNATNTLAATTNAADKSSGTIIVLGGAKPGESATNVAKSKSASENVTNTAKISGTNSTNSVEQTARAGTNSGSASKALAKGAGPGGRPDMGKKGPDVPPAIKARIDRIRDSEILAPVMHPMPMALLGIAGDEAFLRSPEGQTGMIKEGAELGSIKLLKIGVNRVLVEEKGEKKELMIFSGFGGDSLVPKEEKTAAKKDEKKDAKQDGKTQPNKTEDKDKKTNETPTTKPA